MEKKKGHEREGKRKRMLGDNLIMSFWAIFSPESCMAAGPTARTQTTEKSSSNGKVQKKEKRIKIDAMGGTERGRGRGKQ